MKKLLILAIIGFTSLSSFAQQLPDPVWEYSNGFYYYRDNDGRVHYSDGSVTGPNQVWQNSKGQTVYSANSKGPADRSGLHAIQQPRISDNPPGPVPALPTQTRNTNSGGSGGAVFGGVAVMGAGMVAAGVAGSASSNNASNTNTNSNSNSSTGSAIGGAAAGVAGNAIRSAVSGSPLTYYMH